MFAVLRTISRLLIECSMYAGVKLTSLENSALLGLRNLDGLFVRYPAHHSAWI